jgi:uncharacterized membrane protein YeiB
MDEGSERFHSLDAVRGFALVLGVMALPGYVMLRLARREA